MALFAACCSSMAACCGQIPCIGRCVTWCNSCCDVPREVGSEMTEPLTSPSASTIQTAGSVALAASPTIASMGTTHATTAPSASASSSRGDDSPRKRRSVSFVLNAPGNHNEGTGPLGFGSPHNSPGSPTKGIIKKPFRPAGESHNRAEELL